MGGGPSTSFAADLRARLVERTDLDHLDPAEVAVAVLEIVARALHARLALPAAGLPVAPVLSRALPIDEVVKVVGMKRGAIYQKARKGDLPFAHRIPGTRRFRFDEAELARWLRQSR
jgi:excisionase family DNA binding protein